MAFDERVLTAAIILFYVHVIEYRYSSDTKLKCNMPIKGDVRQDSFR